MKEAPWKGTTDKLTKIVIEKFGNPDYLESIKNQEKNPTNGRPAYGYEQAKPKTFTKRKK